MPRYNIKYPLQNGNKGMFATNNNLEDAVRQNIKHLLMTNPGERVMEPEYGCGLRLKLYEPMNKGLQRDIESIIKSGINRFVRNCQLINVSAIIKEDLQYGDAMLEFLDDHSIVVTIEFSVIVSATVTLAAVKMALLITA